jgi:hypothetical protein
MDAGERNALQKTEAAMNHGGVLTRTIVLLIGVGFALSACVAEPVGYGGDGYAYGWGDGWDHGGWGHGFAHGHEGFDEHGGFGEHGGFAEHGGEGEHGGFGGHGGGGGGHR